MKKWFSKILCGIMLLLTFFAFAGCEPKKSEYEITRDVIKGNAKVEVPVDSEIIYHIYKNATSYRDTYSRYTVFEFESEPTEWLKENSFEASLNEEKSNEFQRYFSGMLSSVLNDIGEVSHEYLPNFDNLYYYLKTDNVYFVYLPQNLSLIVILYAGG